ncbi:hypothetical protein Ddye_030287 [Dipteronia dyeriana]|uniref:Reverse transcriptase domain-containing protein n=1 Tax=Dipteronia dyeriana TaxID=168575 RepID=A0AAD9TG22_9ROSI|nr:hypothetical protein Ddye_030287 [Dipteronia dyeriana]
MSLDDFRPISLVGSLYKLLAKVLASRLKRVMNSIIGDSQMAFIKNRQITDCLMIANEVIHKWKRDKVGGLLVKIDFEKAYDCVDHSFFIVYDRGIIRCLVLSSELRINFNKSSIARVCKKESLNENWDFSFRCRKASLPITYLGLPLRVNLELCVEGSGSKRLKEEEPWTPPNGSYPKSLSLLHGLRDAEVVYNPRSSNSFANKLEKMGSTNCGDRIY